MAKLPTDKELEEIYRKGSEQHNFTFNPEAWDRMETLLDKEKKKRFPWFLFSGVLIGLLLATSFFIFNNNSSSDTTDLNHHEFISENNNDINTENHSNTKNLTAISPATTPNESHHEPTETPSPKNPIENKNIIVAQATSNDSNTPDLSFKERRNETLSLEQEENKTPEQKTNLFSNNGINNNATPYGDASNSLVTRGENIAQSRKNREDNKGHLPSSLFNSSLDAKTSLSEQGPVSTKDELTAEEMIERRINSFDFLRMLDLKEFPIIISQHLEAPSIVATDEIEIKTSTPLRYAYGLNLGAESSWTTNGEFSSIDLALGAQGQIFISNKFGFSLDINYLNDFYIAEKGDYKASSDFWKARTAPESTMAQNKMIEFGTGLSYYLSNYNQNGLFFGASVSSTYMINESYEYRYDDIRENFESSWIGENGKLFSSLKLNTGYRFGLSNNYYLQASPYLKLPLSGIGHGDIMLSSFGLNIGIGITK